MFDILIEEDVKSLCVKKELLKTFINCVQKWPKEIKSKTVQELPNMYLFKIVDSLSTYGDFDFQVTLIEIVFRMYGKSAILSKLPDLLPESEELSHSFANINGDTFDEDVRKFLNILNQNSKKVFSVVCKDVFLGRIKCGEPMENVNGLWVDFNRSERSVSWYTTADSLSDADLDEDDAGWNHILFFASDVELVQIYRPPKTNEAIVYVKLREPCLISMKANVEQMESADNVKFILSCESDKAKTLLSQVLPAMFKHKLHNNPFKVSLGSKIVYKPLKVSVRKRAKSDSTKSKSDTSSFSERLNPFCGTKDAYNLQGSSTLHSISSSSTKCDVISISDSSMHSNESRVNLIPKSDDTENSQYETAQICQLDSCKVSSVRHAKKAAAQHGSEVLSDDIFLKEDPRRVQGDIKILSERCSGTKAKCLQSFAATLTPKETPSCKSKESQETEKNIHVWSNVAELSSSDRYETALDFPQTQSQCVMKSCRESGTISKSLTRNKISISKNVDINILKERLLVNINVSHGKDENEMDLSQLKEMKPNRDSKKKTKQISDKENIRKKESPDVPNQDILPASKSTSKKLTVIDDRKYTEMAMDSEKEPNEKLTKGDIEWSEKYPDVLVAHSKPILRENILTTAGIDTQTKMRAKRKSGKAATTADIEPAEKILDVPNQEVEPAVCKPTPKKDTVIDDGKYTELKTDSQQTPNKKVATNDIPLSQEYPDIVSQKIFPAHSKPTLKEDTLSSVGMHTEATMTAKRKSRKNVITIDIKSSEENVHAPNQDVVPAINKPTPKKDTMIMDLQEKPNEKVAPNDVAGSEDILNQKTAKKEKRQSVVVVQKMGKTQESPKPVHPREPIESSCDESEVQIKKPYTKRINVIFSEDDDEIEGNSPGESKQSKTEIIKVQNEVAKEVNNKEHSDNDLFEEANVLTGITDRSNEMAMNLELERQLNASTVEYNMQENIPGLELTHDYERDFDTLKRQQNQTATTLGSRKRRKLYNSEDFNCLEKLVETEDAAWKENKIENVLEAAKSPDKEVIEPSVREQETSVACLKKRVKHRKLEKNDLDKTKKLKVLRPHAVLNVRKPGHRSRLNTAFDKLLDSFRNEAKTSLFDIVQYNTTKASTKPGRKKINKIKKSDKKKLPKKNKRFGEEHKYQRMRARSTSDLSEVSLELKTHDQCCNRETSFESCEERLPPRVRPIRKINIISDIQIRPKRTLLDDKPGITKKKTKNVENPAGVIRDDLSGHMSRAEICNWIEIGSQNYSTKITERRNILKYTYSMLKNALEDPDETEV